MEKYLIARANPTARAFVKRADHFDSETSITEFYPTWIILGFEDDYQLACRRRDEVNS